MLVWHLRVKPIWGAVLVLEHDSMHDRPKIYFNPRSRRNTETYWWRRHTWGLKQQRAWNAPNGHATRISINALHIYTYVYVNPVAILFMFCFLTYVYVLQTLKVVYLSNLCCPTAYVIYRGRFEIGIQTQLVTTWSFKLYNYIKK